MMKTPFTGCEKSSVKDLEQDDGGRKQISWNNMKKTFSNRHDNDPNIVLGWMVDRVM